MNGKLIFVSSSTEARHYAKAIAGFFQAHSVEAMVWNNPGVFSLGGLTFECIEDIAEKIHGAVIIASPDMQAKSNRGPEVISRPNVLLELGFFVGRLSRKQIAFCLFDGVSKPSDLTDFTHLPFGKFVHAEKMPEGKLPELDIQSQNVLSNWCDRLETTRKAESRTIKCHGYSGHWSVEILIPNWRGIQIREPDGVVLIGSLLFHIPHEGNYGMGMLYGKVHVKLSSKGKRKECNRVFRIVDRLDNVMCHRDGSISFTSETVSRELLDNGFGDIPSQAKSNAPGPWTYHWVLNPCEEDEWSFKGKYATKGMPHESWGHVRMKREG